MLQPSILNFYLLLLYASHLYINDGKVTRLNLVPANLQRFSSEAVRLI